MSRQGRAGAGRADVDDELAKSVGIESLDKLQEAIRAAIEREHAAATRRKVKRQLLDALDEKFSLRPAADAFRAGVHQCLAAGRAGHDRLEQDLRGRGHDRGCREGGLSQDRRAPRAPRPRAGRDRREEHHPGHRGRGDARGRRPGPPVPRPGAAGLGVLPQDAAGDRRAARPDLRGQGGRLPPGARQGRGEKGLEGRASQGRRGRPSTAA